MSAPAEPPPSTPAIRRALGISTAEALVVGGMLACTDFFLVPLLQERLGAAAFAVGLMAVVPQLGMVAVGPFVRGLIARLGGNKRATLACCWTQIACLLGLQLPAAHPGEPWAAGLALGLICGFGLSGVFGGPAWMAWMGDLIPERVRGRFTAGRSRVFIASRLAFTLLFAWLARLSPLACEAEGIALILGAAAISRLGSAWLMLRQPELAPRPPRPGTSARSLAPLPRFVGFLRALPTHQAWQWMLVWCALVFGANVAGPFFASYAVAGPQRGGLGLADFSYALLFQVSWLARLAVFPAVGRLIDRHGARAALRLGAFGIVLIPLPWVLTGSWWWLAGGEVLSGVCWALAEAGVGVLLFGCHPQAGPRAQLAAWFFTLSGLATVLGSGLGTLLVRSDLLPELLGSRYRSLFALSLLLRLPALWLALRMLPSLKDDARTGSELWNLVPGIELALTVSRHLPGRSLTAFFRRDG